MKTETTRINDFDMFVESDGLGEPLLLLHGGGRLPRWNYAGGVGPMIEHYPLEKAC